MLWTARHRSAVLLLATLLLAACTQGTPTRIAATVTPTLRPAPAADDPVHAALAALPAASAIGIANDWNGLSLYSPLETHYRLTRQSDHFSGISRTIVNQQPDLPRVTTDTIDLPVARAQEALTILATASLRGGPYEPATSHFDDYPSIVLAFDTPAGLLVFFSRSNTESMQPWGMSFGGRTYVVADDTPERALRLLPGVSRPTGYVSERASSSATATAQGGRGSLFCQQPTIPGDPLIVPPAPLDTTPYTPTAGKYLDQIITVRFSGLSVRGDSLEWSDPQRIAALVALFDRPLPRAAGSGQLAWSYYDTIEIRMQMAGNTFVIATYNPYLDALQWHQGRSASGATITTLAPPDLHAFLLAEICGA